VVKHYPAGTGVFGRGAGTVHAVDGVSFAVRRGETLGLVGESGCGKSTLGRTLVRLLEPTAGEVLFDGLPVFRLTGPELRALRRRLQFVFQDPAASLDPRMTAEAIVAEGLVIHRIGTAAERRTTVRQLFEQVGLGPAHLRRYPHEFSGGQRQRLGIARALALRPELIICDEPVSALDVSVQAQVVNLLLDLQRAHGLTYIFIAHDLRLVHHLSDRVAVMYLGQIVELADRDAVYRDPLHPYTQALLSAVPRLEPGATRPRLFVEGEPPSPTHPPAGCRFHPRCPKRFDRCGTQPPALKPARDGRLVACHLYDEAATSNEQ
jgi:oligopeptide/dipeptide ABC transporter ATP-binding protein